MSEKILKKLKTALDNRRGLWYYDLSNSNDYCYC